MVASERISFISNQLVPSAETVPVPVINFGRFLSGSDADKRAIASELMLAARDVGK